MIFSLEKNKPFSFKKNLNFHFEQEKISINQFSWVPQTLKMKEIYFLENTLHETNGASACHFVYLLKSVLKEP